MLFRSLPFACPIVEEVYGILLLAALAKAVSTFVASVLVWVKRLEAAISLVAWLKISDTYNQLLVVVL